MNGSNPGAAYDFGRTEKKPESHSCVDSLEYSSQVDSESYLDIHTVTGGGDASTSVTGQVANVHHNNHNDATDTVHEMHLALLYLMSNPDEFHRALAVHPARGATTLQQWNAEYDNESMTEAESIMTNNESSQQQQQQSMATPLPFVVFADDAEVVLPQAHTASQLFGLERLEGIELEAAAGIPALSQLFLRWLALMPGGDHLNIIDPPGLTVMRIAGGRYRVTAAHRVVWTWMNEFAALTDKHSSSSSNTDDSVNALQVGDLVTMTIVDVFETDNQGKLLSYCPTFDNRAVHKTHHTAETFRKSSSKLVHMLGKAQKSQAATMLVDRAKSMAKSVVQKVDEAVHHYNSPRRKTESSEHSSTIEPAPSVVEAADEIKAQSVAGSSYMADDDTERHEV